MTKDKDKPVYQTDKPRKEIVFHLVNSTNKTFKFKRGTAVARIGSILEENLVSFEKEIKNANLEKEVETEVNVPPEHKEIVDTLLSKNTDVFALKDSELGHTETNPPMQNKRFQLWALGITGYNCKIEWLAGTENTIADYLSRRPNQIEVNKSDNKKTDDEDIEIDISDKAYEINTINSNEIDKEICKL
ncbi:unnamed protein product [Mytilus coruscus]|uniref:Reverse transcriptase RNase H-like domain-containing protein n=1 Tax=Mytilus coruscus TaxID=42192 RepID=A0A6J8EEH2_MYTCO|nr:unnamed protein product [Mytilus coruscus]